MSLTDQILADYQDALRARETVRAQALRLLRAALKDAEIEAGKPLDDEAVQRVIQRQAKQRRDSIEAYRAGGREDLAAHEQDELAIFAAYLPAELGEEELTEMARAAIAETGATSAQQLGAVMKVLMPRVQGRADGRRVSGIVRELLGG